MPGKGEEPGAEHGCQGEHAPLATNLGNHHHQRQQIAADRGIDGTMEPPTEIDDEQEVEQQIDNHLCDGDSDHQASLAYQLQEHGIAVLDGECHTDECCYGSEKIRPPARLTMNVRLACV